MERTLKKIIFDWVQFFFFAAVYAGLIYLGFIEDLKGARNVFYCWQIFNLICLIIALVAYTHDEKYKEKSLENRYKAQRYIGICLQLIYIGTLLWLDYFYAGIMQFVVFFILQICHAALDDLEKKRKEKLDNLPQSVFPTQDVFPPDWEDL